VVTRLDRLARNTKDALALLDRIHAAKCGLKVLDMDINTATPSGKVMFTILSATIHGLPVDIKDLEATAGLRTTQGSLVCEPRGGRHCRLGPVPN
jgi:hypothetical protein